MRRHDNATHTYSLSRGVWKPILSGYVFAGFCANYMAGRGITLKFEKLVFHPIPALHCVRMGTGYNFL